MTTKDDGHFKAAFTEDRRPWRCLDDFDEHLKTQGDFDNNFSLLEKAMTT